jgi:hypothetical protein
VAVLVLFGGGGLVAMVLGAGEAMKGECGGIVAVIVGLVFLLVGVGALVAGVKGAAAEKAVGAFTIELDRGRARAGDEVVLTARLRPPAPLEIKSITATIEGFEKCVSGSGTNKTTHTNTFLTHTEELCASQRLEASRETVLQGAFRLPADAAFSFKSSSNEVVWRITLRIEPSGHVAVKQEVPIEVVP